MNANTAEGGAGALFSLTTGDNNTAVGSQALFSLTIGSQNTATGAQALKNNTADKNTAHGFQALVSNTIGINNTATGWRTLFKNTTGDDNHASGAFALYNNATGSENTAVGISALGGNETGSFNTAIGNAALPLTTGSFNTGLGFLAGGNVTTADHVICIGARGDNVSASCFIGNIYGTTTAINDAVPVLIDSLGQLGTMSSSRRYKTDIKALDKASESILGLKPVSFRYKVHKDTTPQFGLIAEDVAKVDPDLVIYDADGKPYTVRYDAVNAMLLNEFLKEHRKNAEQEATITQIKQDFQSRLAQQQKQIDALTAGLQKVGARLEASKPAPQMVNNP